jgi:hypothetical protein
MPGLFAGEEAMIEKVEALVEYLAVHEMGCASGACGRCERAKSCYHKVGCVTCHEPALDVRPPKVPADAEVEKPGNGSVPIALADAIQLHLALVFSEDPLSMPPFRPHAGHASLRPGSLRHRGLSTHRPHCHPKWTSADF